MRVNQVRAGGLQSLQRRGGTIAPTEDVQRLKSARTGKAPMNNLLTVLNTLLRTAVEWRVIEAIPCTIRLLKVVKPSARFHDFDAFERLAAAQSSIDENSDIEPHQRRG
jgi:hypothetical protein